MPNALASTAILPHHSMHARVVDLRAQLRACPVEDRPAWLALQKHLLASLEQHSHELHIDSDTHGLKLRCRTLSGFTESRLVGDDVLVVALTRLEQQLWPEQHRSLGSRAWFIINLGTQDYLLQVDHVTSSGGANYSFRCLYDIQNPLPQLDQLITLPGQAVQLRSKIEQMKGLVLLADSDRISRVKTARAMAQGMASPDRRILLSETSCHPLVPGTTQIALPLHAQREHHEAWRQACDMSHDVIIALEIDHEPARLAQLAAEGSQIIQGVGADNASQAMAQLIANGVRPEAVSRVLSCIVVQHQIAVACEACKCPAEIDETDNERIGLQNLIRAQSIQNWLAERMKDNFVQADGCCACNHTGVSKILLTIDCIDVGHDIQDALSDGDVRYAMHALSKLESHTRHLISLARAGTVSVKHAVEQLKKRQPGPD